MPELFIGHPKKGNSIFQQPKKGNPGHQNKAAHPRWYGLEIVYYCLHIPKVTKNSWQSAVAVGSFFGNEIRELMVGSYGLPVTGYGLRVEF